VNCKAIALRAPPTYLLVGLTNLCTTRCKFCYRRDLHLEPQYFPLDRFKLLVDELGPSLKILEFSGIGEPLLHKQFKEFVLYVRNKYTPQELTLGLISNASLLTSDTAKLLVEHEFGHTWFSLNAATPETHAKLMPGLDLGRIVNSVIQLTELRDKVGSSLPVIRLSFVVTKDNYFEAEDFIDLAIKLHADEISIGSVSSALAPQIREQQHVPKEKFEPILERIENRARKDRRIRSVPKWYFWPESYKQPAEETAVGISCGNVNEVFGIYLTSGQATFCPYMAAEIENENNCLGNIHQSSALEIWNGVRANAFLQSIADIKTAPDVCKRCTNSWNKTWIQPK
jgi:MoaA/NifB/PqqE/SkfB family radical SAM enzyme